LWRNAAAARLSPGASAACAESHTADIERKIASQPRKCRHFATVSVDASARLTKANFPGRKPLRKHYNKPVILITSRCVSRKGGPVSPDSFTLFRHVTQNGLYKLVLAGSARYGEFRSVKSAEKSMTIFTGLTPDALDFLQLLSRNNSKEWFSANRETYDWGIVSPLRALVATLAPDMRLIDDRLEVRPAVGKTLSRIHRDTRFSHDKSPYRSNVWIYFKRPRKTLSDSPTFFFEISYGGWRYGMGYYSASHNTMARFRDYIADNPRSFLRTVADIRCGFALVGESYKRPRGQALPPELADWYNKKTFALIDERQDMASLYTAELADILRDGFRRLAPLYQVLTRLE
jgi:uncharacterized protein (TIGR02453 family)